MVRIGAWALLCGAPLVAAAQDAASNPRVVLEIEENGKRSGTIVIELYPDKAPKTVENFLRYVDDGFYDGTIVHRVVKDFLIQGGGYTDPQTEKTAGLRDPITNEAKNGLKNLKGTIAAARDYSDPHSASSQFFISLVDNDRLDYPSRDGFGFCVFGKVVSGMQVVERIGNLPIQPHPLRPGEPSLPLNPPKINRARRLPTLPARDQPPATQPGAPPGKP
jgi:peptidyl-prolyl cis-trans isomerase A (cyclophilin A)